MRLTCLRCGHQTEFLGQGTTLPDACSCGNPYRSVTVRDLGVRPNQRAADKLRQRAFLAAGVVRNLGGFALGLSLLGIICFPFGLLGALCGLYVCTMLSGPVRRYSGRGAAIAAIVLGALVFTGEGSFLLSWMEKRHQAEMQNQQESIGEDLRALLRAQRFFHAENNRYGNFQEINFRPPHGRYTIYFGKSDFIAGKRDEVTHTESLPTEFNAKLEDEAFFAVAVANLDDDADVDVWLLNHRGSVSHPNDDLISQALKNAPTNIP